MRINLSIAIITVLTGLSFGSDLSGYPPENAAVLYYKAAMEYAPGDEVKGQIFDAAKGDMEIDEGLTKEIKGHDFVIKNLTNAGKVTKCDWGIDYSRGIATILTGLSDMKQLGGLLVADSRVLCLEGKYKKAMERCLTTEQLASHVSDMTLISGLVGTAISAMGDKCITHILGEMPQEEKQLLQVKKVLGKFKNRIDRIKVGLDGEKILAIVHFDTKSEMRMTPKMLEEFGWEPKTKEEEKINKILIEKVGQADEEFFKKMSDYWCGMIDKYIASFELTYAEAYEKMSVEIPEMIVNDSQKKPEAALTRSFMPALGKVYSLSIKSQSSLDALKAAVEVYLVKARTGKLPVKLPAGCPKDIFSGKDFVYEKTEGGFLLKCQGKDLAKDKVHEYEFKVKGTSIKK